MASAPGWHPDPSGRHQHRFWDGTAWTAQVADAGVTADDPLDAPVPQAAAPGAAGGPPPTYAPLPTTPSRMGGKAPLLIVVAVLVAVAVAGALVYVTGGDDDDADGGGAGTFAIDSTAEEITVHRFDLAPGEIAVVRATKVGRAHLGLGVSRADASRLLDIDGLYSDGNDLGDLYSDSNDQALDLFSDLTDEQGDLVGLLTDASDDYVALPGYDGLLLASISDDQLGAQVAGDIEKGAVSTSIVAPTELHLAVLVVGDQKGIQLDVRTKANPAADRLLRDGSLDSDDLSTLFSDDFYRDYVSDLSSDLDLPSTDDTDTGGS